MKLYVGITDRDWFEHLKALGPDEVNFWKPGGSAKFRALQPGELFLFKLHAPHNYIVGGGFFVRFSILPNLLAWDTFGVLNGAPDYASFRNRIDHYRAHHGTLEINPSIGCIILNHPVFLDERDWIPVPPDFALNIVQGKTYDTATEIGARLWDWARVAFATQAVEYQRRQEIEDQPVFGDQYLVRARLGQGAFRVSVLDAYGRRCSMTGERTIPVLDSAHIKPVTSEGPHRVSNGLLLRSDLHILFDQGYMTVAPDYRINVSQRIHEEFDNGKEYYALHGRELQLPERTIDRPSREFVEWHNNTVFTG